MISLNSDESITLDQIQQARELLGELVRRTPIWEWRSTFLSRALGDRSEVFLKLELFQFGGSFKSRGALCVMQSIPENRREAGVTAVSAGNHAIAVGYAAQVLGLHAKVVMISTANAARIKACENLGTEVILVDSIHEAFERAKHIEEHEGRTYVHPFEGPYTALGTATVGLELCEQVPNLDAVVIPIGGGGLCAGISFAVKQLNPKCTVYGVEPEGADSMHRSFAAGEPSSIDKVRTIADSLGAPYALPYSFAMCRENVDELVMITDEMMIEAMRLLAVDMKLMVEPAAASATAALLGPLREKLMGKRVGLIVCGSNIDPLSFQKLIS